MLPLLNSLNIDNIFLEKLTKYETLFASKYSFSNEDIIVNFEKHKKEAIKNEFEADTWLAKGIEIKKGDACPFCGNNIKDSGLVASYLTIFCSDFQEYNQKIEWLLKEKFKINFSNTEVLLSQNITKIDKLRKGITNSEIVNLSTAIENLTVLIDNFIGIIKNDSVENKKAFETSQKSKAEDCYNKTEYDCTTLKTSFEILNGKFIDYNNAVENLNAFAKKYLEELSIEMLEKEIEECEKTLNEKRYLFERNHWDKEIIEYLELEKSIKDNAKLKKAKKEVFDKENNEFLQKYFESLNKYFDRLNSKNFTINKEELSSRAKKKVYSLVLKYRDKVVESDKINSVLSESDRRALALSIFLSAVQQNKDTNAVIIFDDPIVSFDIERMNEFVNIIKELFNNCKQIIIFTHYENFYKILVELTKTQIKERSLIKIKDKKETNTFEMIDIENESMLLDDFQKIINRAINFVNKNCTDYTSNDARTLMEKVLGYRFAKEISDKTVIDIANGLGEFLLDLKNKNIITPTKYTEWNNKREELNNPSHSYDSHTLTARRKCVELLWDSLHTI